MAPDRANESPKDALERRQAEEVKAWIEWDNKQTAAQAQIDALAAQPTSADAAIQKAQQAARDVNDAKVKDAIAKKAAIEYAWEHELKCPLKRLFVEIEKAVSKERTERLVDGTNRPKEGDATREQVQDLKAETLMHAAQALLHKSYIPQYLLGGPNQRDAVALVRPDLVEELSSADATAELSAYVAEIQPIYDRQALYYEAAKAREAGVVIGKTGETLSEAISDPSRLGAGLASLIGVGMMYFGLKDKSADGNLKKWVIGLLGLGMAGVGGYFAVTGKDLASTAAGLHMDGMFSSPEMDKARVELGKRLGTQDAMIIDNMLGVSDSPIENFGEAYLAALSGHNNGLEKERLTGDKGLSDKEASLANDKFLKQGGDLLFMKCYEMGINDKTIKQPLTNVNAQRAAGAQYAKERFEGLTVGSILVAMDMVAAGIVIPPATVESHVTDPHLRELEKQDRAFAKVLESTDQPDVYLINGYPVRYNYTDTEDHVFTDVLGRVTFVKVDKSLTGDALQSTLLRIAEEAKKAAITIYSFGTGALATELKYNNHGDWIIDPPRPRAAHAGLPTYLRGPNDPKVPVILYFDTADNKVKVGMDKDGDGVPEKRVTPYTSIADVDEEFEKGILHDLIAKDTSRTLLAPFKVERYRDVGTDTEVDITYGNGAQGTMTYRADALHFYVLSAPIDAKLTADWTKTATDTCKLKVLGDPRVQDALLRATTGYTEYNRGLMAGLVSKFVGLAKDGVDWFTNDSIQNEFDDNWEKQVVKKMTDLLYDPVNGLTANYVKDVFKTFPSDAKFQSVEDTFINTQVTSIAGAGVVTATVTPEALPDQTLKPGDALRLARSDDLKERGGNAMIRAALEPLKTETPANMPGWFQSAWQGAKNTFTNDAIRTEYYEKKVAEYQGKLEKNINTLEVAAAAATPPTQLTRKQVEAEIAKIQLQAQTEAINYTGLDNPAAIKKLLLAPAENAEPEWKAASEKVIDYLTNNMKWEKYAMIPSPENMSLVLDLWYQRVGTPNLAAGAAVTAGDPMKFADYFIWEQQIRFGGHQDYSPDRFYGDVQSVSDTNFKSMITSLRSSVVAYDPTWKGRPILRPNTPDMPPSLEVYRQTKRQEFNDWFEVNGDCAKFLRMDGEWPEIFRISVQARLSQIIDGNWQTEASLKQDIDDFKLWVDIERYNIFEPLIGRADAQNHGYQVNTRIINNMMSYFYAVPRDLNAYTYFIQQQMRVLK